MSTTTRILAQPKTANLVGSSTAPSAGTLFQRIKAEVAAAAARVLTLQTEAAKTFAGKEQ